MPTGRSPGLKRIMHPPAERWIGATWTAQRLPKPPRTQDSRLDSDSCALITACLAVRSYFTTRMVPPAERWSGGRWTIQRAAQPAGRTSAGLTGVSCPPPSLDPRR